MYHEKYGFQKEIYRPIDTARKNPNPFVYKHGEKLVYPCSPGVSSEQVHGSRIIPQCGSWDCNYCGPQKKAMLKKEINDVRQRHGGRWLFSVLTFSSGRGGVRNYDTGRYLKESTQKAYYRKWIRDAKKVIGTDAYVMIPEWQRNGAIHFNIVWFGENDTFTDCVGKNKLDLRRVCGRCKSCALRALWRGISGAPRSTHGYVRGNVGGYATKYVTKALNQAPEGNTTRRYAFSRACKRSVQIIPVYQYLYRRLLEGGKWHLNTKKSKLSEKWRDYVTPAGAFFFTDSKFSVGKDSPFGRRVPNVFCGAKHDMLCETMAYMSPARLKAWGNPDAAWAEVTRKHGHETTRVLRKRLARALWSTRKHLRGWRYDDGRYYHVVK